MRRGGRRGFWPLRDLPALLWLVAVPVVAVASPVVPAPRWLMVHLLLLGAVTHSILVWSKHFADALLHTAPRAGERRTQRAQLLLLNAGAALVVVGVPGDVWPVTVVGAVAVTVAVGWHGTALVGQLRRALPARFGATVHYYLAAAALLPAGVLLGVLLARGPASPGHARLMLAHEVVNLFGWMGLTVVGTLVTLWPTMLRTRIADGAERAARRALPVLVTAVVVAAGGALLGRLPVVALGLLGYLAGLGVLTGPFVTAARQKPPAAFPTWSVLAGLGWLAGSLAALVTALVTTSSWQVVHQRADWLVPALAAGFAAQVLLGALSYLVPVALGGGPTPARAANAALDRGWPVRLAMVNAGLLVALLPVPALARELALTLVLGGLATFVPLLLLAIRASRRAKAAGAPLRR